VKLVTFPNLGRFFQYVEQAAATRADWASFRWRAGRAGEPWALQVPRPDALDDERTGAPEGGAAEELRTLGELWRHARPIGRGPTAVPSCWLLVLGSEAPEVYEYVLARAAANLCLLELRASPSEPPVRALLLSGLGGRVVAAQPPPGCVAYECDEVASHGPIRELGSGFLAALPAGWTVPRIPELLWPAPRGTIALYDIGAERRHSVRVLQVVALTALADLLAPSEPCLPERRERALAAVPSVTWRVARRHDSTLVTSDAAELFAGRPTIFRLRTRKDQLGEAMLRVLDEAESHRLPRLQYVAFGPLERPDEEWHLLYAERVDARLLSAWNTLERFDVVPELREHGLEVFVSRDTRLVPSFEHVVSAPGDRARALAKIRTLLGDPPPGTLVLIEADAREGRGSSSGKPIVTHVPRAATAPLGEVLDAIVRTWHVEPLAGAWAAASAPAALHAWRERASAELQATVADEQAELERAADDAVTRLDEEAARAIAELEPVCALVDEASALAGRMQAALSDSESTFDAVLERLARLCEALVEPRRVWLDAQQAESRARLESLAALLEAPADVHAVSLALQAQLAEATEQLGTAAAALRELGPELDRSRAAAELAATQAREVRTAIEQRAADVERDVTAERRVTARELERGQARHAEVEALRRALADERAQVDTLERENRETAQANERTRYELRLRREAAQLEVIRLVALRDVEIPQLRTDTGDAERQLRELRPARITRELVVASKARARAGAALAEAEGRAERLRQEQREQVRVDEQLAAMRRDLAALERRVAAEPSLDFRRSVLRDALQRIQRGPSRLFGWFRR